MRIPRPRLLFFVGVPLVVCAFSIGKQNSASLHQHPNISEIDGHLTPDLIPDPVAYRLFFIAASVEPSASAAEISAHDAKLAKLHLDEGDRVRLEMGLSSFKSEYLALMQNFNRQATAALSSGQQIDMTKFLVERDALVEATRSRLRQDLSADAMGRLDAQVQDEKRKMKIVHPKGAQ